MNFQLIALLSAITASPVENHFIDKRAWVSSSKPFTGYGGVPGVVSKFKIVLASDNAAKFRYRLRFLQDSVTLNYQSYANTNNVVRFFGTDVEEEWNAIGQYFILDRIVPGSGVWQDEKWFAVSCSQEGTVNTFAYAGTITFNCILK